MRLFKWSFALFGSSDCLISRIIRGFFKHFDVVYATRHIAFNSEKFYNRRMPESVDWEDKKYQEVFEDETRLLVRRRAADTSCTVDDIQGILDALYVLDGNNAEGRSSVQQIVLSATIAAYEAFIHQWKKETAV